MKLNFKKIITISPMKITAAVILLALVIFIIAPPCCGLWS